MTAPAGSQHYKAVLTENVVREMRQQHFETGLCVRCIAKLWGRNYQTVSDAVHGRTWKGVK